MEPAVLTTPSSLTPEIRTRIDSILVTEPKIDKHTLAIRLGIEPEVLKDLIIKDRQEEILREAEIAIRDILHLNLNDPHIEAKYGKAKLALLKLKLDKAQFICESLGKDQGYSKRTEVTGKDGADFVIKAIVFHPPVMPTNPPQTI